MEVVNLLCRVLLFRCCVVGMAPPNISKLSSQFCAGMSQFGELPRKLSPRVRGNSLSTFVLVSNIRKMGNSYRNCTEEDIPAVRWGLCRGIFGSSLTINAGTDEVWQYSRKLPPTKCVPRTGRVFYISIVGVVGVVFAPVSPHTCIAGGVEVWKGIGYTSNPLYSTVSFPLLENRPAKTS
eukprot:546295-Rhodomonas_salina.3